MYQLNVVSTASYSGAEGNFQQSSEAPALFYHYKNSLWNLTKQERGRQEHFYLKPIHLLLLWNFRPILFLLMKLLPR